MVSPQTAIALGAIPAACMLLCTFLGLGVEVPHSLAGALQHFAAGVLLCTIGTELLPAMVDAAGWEENLAAAAGFFAGVAVLIAIGAVLPETDDDEDDDEEEATKPTGGGPSSSLSAGRRPLGKGRSFRASAQLANAPSMSPPSSPTATEATRLVSRKPNKPFPMALVLAVAIDSLMDGLLVGIALAAGPSAGPMMAASLSVEMSFLGLTLATALQGHPRSKSALASFLGPASIVVGAAVGGTMASRIGDDPVLLAGMLSFGTSALLFMVAEELLLEAHEGEGRHLWWVDLQLYTGFFASVVAGKFAPS